MAAFPVLAHRVGNFSDWQNSLPVYCLPFSLTSSPANTSARSAAVLLTSTPVSLDTLSAYASIRAISSGGRRIVTVGVFAIRTSFRVDGATVRQCLTHGNRGCKIIAAPTIDRLVFEHCRADAVWVKISDHSRKEIVMTAVHAKRFIELTQQLEQIQATKTVRPSSLTGSSYMHIDSMLVLNWAVKVRSLLERLGTETASQLKSFVEAEKYRPMETELDRLNRLEAIFLATKEDFEGGYLVSFRSLVQAEVFTSELEQADELLSSGYATAAAVIAGVVLETTLRDMCTAHGIDHGKLDKMNAELAKAGAYHTTQQKRITALAGIRNSAAHGKPEEFTKADVRGMIDDVERFLAAQL